MKYRNDIEKTVAEVAVLKYRERLVMLKSMKELLATKKFKYGDYVTRKDDTYFDGVFDTPKIGKVVWFDKENDYYRVRYDDHSSFIGTKEERLELYEGEPPEHLVDYDISDSFYVTIHVKKDGVL